MQGQMSIFDFPEYLPSEVKTCECGNKKLAVKYTGCGSPIGGYKSYPLVFEHHLYCIFCPICYRVATSKGLGWRSNKLSIKDALKDWNENPHKQEESRFIKGRFGLEGAKEEMKQTIELMPEIIDILGDNHVWR